MNVEEREKAEDELVSRLEEERKEKKMQHEKEWILWKDKEMDVQSKEGGEATEDDGNDDAEGVEDVEDAEDAEDEWATEEDNNQWVTEEEIEKEEETEEEEKRLLGMQLRGIVNRHALQYEEKVVALEEIAKKRFQELFPEENTEIE